MECRDDIGVDGYRDESSIPYELPASLQPPPRQVEGQVNFSKGREKRSQRGAFQKGPIEMLPSNPNLDQC